MLIQLQLRLCGLSAMAPALTEAASQAQSFKLPFTSAEIPDPADIVISFLNPSNRNNCQQQLAFDFDQHNHVFWPNLKHLGSHQGRFEIPLKKSSISYINNILAIRNPTDSDPSSALCEYNQSSELSPINTSLESNSVICFEGKTSADDCYSLCTMNNSEKDCNRTLDAMGMSKASANLKFSRDKIKSNNNTKQTNNNGGSPVSTQYSDFDVDLASPESIAVMSTSVAIDELEISEELPVKEILTQKLHEARLRQASLERITDNILGRVSKLQAKQASSHIHDQLTKFLVYQQKTLHLPTKHDRCKQGLHGYGGISNSSSVDIKAEILQSENVKNLSTAALVSLVRKLESTPRSALRQKYVALQHLRSVDKTENSNTVTKIPKEMCSEMEHIAGTLTMNVKCLETGADSDATESSSGGESCDELDEFDEKQQTSSTTVTPICKRAAWKWAVNRASIASRWIWLQAQVSDLEYRIRQQNEFYRHLRSTKGSLIFSDIGIEEVNEIPSKHTPCNPSRLGHKLPVTESASSSLERRNDMNVSPFNSVETKSLLTQSNSSRHPTHMNGIVNPGSNNLHDQDIVEIKDLEGKSNSIQCSGNIDGVNDGDSNTLPGVSDFSCTASRVRPLISFRKRKLLRSVGFHQINKKAAKLSNVLCCCVPPLTPCVMCGGRVNSIQQVDPDTMPIEERLGLLDSSFHPVLSLDQDVPLYLHFESLLKSGEWQKTVQKPKSYTTNRKKSRLSSPNSDHVHKHSQKLKKNAAATLAARLKKKLGEEKRPRGRGSSITLNNKNGVRKRHNLSQIPMGYSKRERSLSGSSGSSSKPVSPVPSLSNSENMGNVMSLGSQSGFDQKDHPRKLSILQDMMRRRRGESAFDINNIVIPYSMAAATRVERLQYKEILTPKWRFVEEVEEKEVESPSTLPKNNGLVVCKSNEDEGIEDLSDDIFIIRHGKCEEEEKKRFMSYVQTQWTNRGRMRSIRGDSRADSSGANTPDPLSPYPMEHRDSPLTTPPSTPAPFTSEENSNYSTRRRTTSLSKRDRFVDDFRTATPEIEEEPIPPWDTRTFPLADTEVEEMLKLCSQTPPMSPYVVSEEPNVITVPSTVASQPVSPLSSSSTSVMGEDPNDPEWTVATMPPDKGPRPGIVIKLAKR